MVTNKWVVMCSVLEILDHLLYKMLPRKPTKFLGSMLYRNKQILICYLKNQTNSDTLPKKLNKSW